MPNLLTNHFGRDYRVVESGDADSWTLRLRTDGYETVAYAFLEKEKERTLVLSDFCVNEAAKEASAWWNCFAMRRRVQSFRGLGLGSALLRYLLDRAREEGFLVIEGRVTSDDAGRNPWLLAWYRKFDFLCLPVGNEIHICRALA